MAIQQSNNVIVFDTDGDSFIPTGRVKFKGARLIAGSDQAEATIHNLAYDGNGDPDDSGQVLMHLKTDALDTDDAGGMVDESSICFTAEDGIVVKLSGTGAILYLYKE